MADDKGKRRRSLHEAFLGQEIPARPPTEPTAAAPGRDAAPGPAEAGDGARSGARRRPRNTQRSNGRAKTGESQGATKAGGGDKENPAPITGREEVEMVPGKGGKMVPAEKPVNMTFTVTARERYLWTLELKRRGLTAVSVLRETMEEMMKEANR